MSNSVSTPCKPPQIHTRVLTISLQAAYKHYVRALSRWPKDALRPERQLQEVIGHRVNRRYLPAAALAARTTEGGKDAPKETPLKPTTEKDELEQANALYSLLENRYSRKVR